MRTISEVAFPDTVVMFVAGDPTKPIPEQSRQSFAALEAKLSLLKGRKCFGVLLDDEYRACASILDRDRSAELPHPTWTIPGGKYARIRIPDWQKNTNRIGAAFDELYSRPDVDYARPALEHYRSQEELFVMVPIN
ncbi:MAG: hypothetical protein ACFCVA_05770 [Gammaproteobacteria bacterium]